MPDDTPSPQDPLPADAEAAALAIPEQDSSAPTDAPDKADASAVAALSPAACGQELKLRFPALFGGAAKPLKLRIQLDIQERAPGIFSKQVLSAFFRRYTGSTSYLMACSKASHRFDLDGKQAGELSDEHRQAATQELARRRAVQNERRALEEQQQRNRAGLLRAHETTTLTQANFCALMGVAPDELEGLLMLARQEAEQRAQQAPSRQPSPHARARRGTPERQQARRGDKSRSP